DSLKRLAARDHTCSLGHRVVHQFTYSADRIGIDQGPATRLGVSAVTGLDRAHTGCKLLDERVVHATLHIETVGRCAGFAAIAHFRDKRTLDRRVQIGVVKYDEGSVATELH